MRHVYLGCPACHQLLRMDRATLHPSTWQDRDFERVAAGLDLHLAYGCSVASREDEQERAFLLRFRQL